MVNSKSLKNDQSPRQGLEDSQVPLSVEENKAEEYDEGAIPTDTYNYPEFDYAHNDNDD